MLDVLCVNVNSPRDTSTVWKRDERGKLVVERGGLELLLARAHSRACWPRPSAVSTLSHLTGHLLEDVRAARRGTLSLYLH